MEIQSISIHSPEEWERQIGESFFPLTVNNIDPSFVSQITIKDLPRGMRFSEVRAEGSHLKRTERLVRTAPSDHALALFQLTGRAVMRQGNRQVLLEKGSAALADPGTPYEVALTRGSHELVVLIPIAALQAHDLGIEDVRTRLLPASSISVRSLATLTTELVSSPVEERETEGIAAAALDMFRAALSAVSTEPLTPALTHEAQLRLVKEFIETRIADPRLDLEMIARAHGFSVRHLATLFAQEGSPGSYVRARRLQGFWQDLTDPKYALVPGQELATKWGFERYATASRAFQRKFGMTPAEARRRAY
ncbi:MAG: helix-turn-helix domain-containing protein [Leucobacter sp.]